jgi:hypothetical protein
MASANGRIRIMVSLLAFPAQPRFARRVKLPPCRPAQNRADVAMHRKAFARAFLALVGDVRNNDIFI